MLCGVPSPASPLPPDSRLSRFRGIVEVEDVLLFIWAAAPERLVTLDGQTEPLDLFVAGDFFTPFGWFALAGVVFVAVTEQQPEPRHGRHVAP
jgi:hypothetical protein